MLDVSGASTADGGAVIQWSWSHGTHQQWKPASSPTSDHYQLLNVHNDWAPTPIG